VTTILEVSGLVHHFRGARALDGVDLRLRRGESLGLIGPNGAGKSTLFRGITGLLKLDGGRIVFDGTDLGGKSVEQRYQLGIGWAFQHPRCFPSLTVHQHLALALEGASVERSDPGAEEDWLRRVGLRERAGEYASHLSLAERKLLDVARAACGAPDLLLLDEPFAGLGAREAQLLGVALAALRSAGVSLILIEHRIAELLEQVQQIAVLAAGRIIHRGPARLALRSPNVLQAYFGVDDE